ncbi:hypothetical protein [Bacillus paramycoides]|uniref:hypothetical protein n=1 Tax=Bacillus paramycoides TaxID=2026194 RepID=UPI001FD19814|nr:hypothetical protein [Bacillus paramycoides]
MFLNHQLLVEKEKVDREVITVIEKSNLTNIEREQVLQAMKGIDKNQNSMLKSEEANKLYEKMKQQHKQGIVYSFDKTFLMGSVIFTLALICNVVDMYVSRKKGTISLIG